MAVDTYPWSVGRSGGFFWYFHVWAESEATLILPYVNSNRNLRNYPGALVLPRLMDDRVLREDPYGVEWTRQTMPMKNAASYVYLPEEWPDFGPIMDLLGL